jgi:hypothetical protein
MNKIPDFQKIIDMRKKWIERGLIKEKTYSIDRTGSSDVYNYRQLEENTNEKRRFCENI